MAIYSGQVVVGTTPTAIDGADKNPIRIIVHNTDQLKGIFLGNSTVATTTGLELDKHGQVELILNPNESLYAIVDSGTATLSYLKQVY